MTDPTAAVFGGGMGNGGTFVNFADMIPAALSYIESLSQIDQLEVIGIITILLALSQIALCSTLALDNYQAEKRMRG